MFVAPPEYEVEWSDAGLEGSFRFLGRVWRVVVQWAEVLRDGVVPPVDERRAERGGARAAPEDPRHHQTGDGRSGSARALEHRRVGADGAGERALPVHRGAHPHRPDGTPGERSRSGRRSGAAGHAGRAEGGRRGARPDARALHAAHRGRAVGAAGTPGGPPRRPLAVGGCGRGAGQREGGARAGQRQGQEAACGWHPDVSDQDLRELALADPSVRAFTDGKTVATSSSPAGSS